MKKLLPLLFVSLVLFSCNDLTEQPQAPEPLQPDTSEYVLSLSDQYYAQVVYVSNGKKVNRLGKATLERHIVFKNCEAVGHSTSVGKVLVNGIEIAEDSIVSIDLGGSIKYPQN